MIGGEDAMLFSTRTTRAQLLFIPFLDNVTRRFQAKMSQIWSIFDELTQEKGPKRATVSCGTGLN
jgi:hypothetical protein